MGCKRVNGYLSLGLILYVLTFTYAGVMGETLLSGTSDSLECASPVGAGCDEDLKCCGGFICNPDTNTCVKCPGNGEFCVGGVCCTGFCCDDLTYRCCDDSDSDCLLRIGSA